MSWGSEHWLWGLSVPLLLLIWNITRRRRSRAARSLQKAHFVTAGFNSVRLTEKRARKPIRWFLYAALALLVVSMARPRWGTEERTTFERSREVIIAIDLSKSMLAEDLKPNRLERAKLVVDSMLDTLQGESVGLVVFAGTAFLQSPMSPDYQILRGFLRDLNPSFVPQGGTNYSEMLETALDSFEQSDGMADRFLIVISDGETQDQDWQPLARELKEQNVTAICLGFGTEAGSLIPDGSGGYHKDSQGAVVLSRLERGTLKELATITGGVYRDAAVWVDLATLVEETVKRGRAALIERSEEQSQVERYHYFLAPALLLLLVSIHREFPTLPKARHIKREARA